MVNLKLILYLTFVFTKGTRVSPIRRNIDTREWHDTVSMETETNSNSARVISVTLKLYNKIKNR